MDDELVNTRPAVDPPRETWLTNFQKLGLSAVDLATLGTGGIILSMVLGMGRRREAFDREVAERIEELEKLQRTDRTKLAEDQQFISTYIDATIAAVKTNNSRKRHALRNAILNSALPNSPNETKQAIFIRLIDELTELHLVTLEYLRNRKYAPGRLEAVLKKDMRQLEDSGLFALVTDELTSRNLIRPNMTGGVTYLNGEEMWAKPLGIEFLEFIVDPLATADTATV